MHAPILWPAPLLLLLSLRQQGLHTIREREEKERRVMQNELKPIFSYLDNAKDERNFEIAYRLVS